MLIVFRIKKQPFVNLACSQYLFSWPKLEAMQIVPII